MRQFVSIAKILDILCPSRAVIRKAKRLEANRKARVAVHDDSWRKAHPELASKGVPPPPTPDSMTRIGVYSLMGGFYVPE